MFMPLGQNEYYRFLNYPKLPFDIVNECLELIRNEKIIKDSKRKFGLSEFNKLETTPYRLSECCAGILKGIDYRSVLVQWFDNGHSIPAHRDHINDQQINYYISEQSTPTSFYEPIANYEYYNQRGKYVDMKDLIKTDSIVFPRETWILFNAMSLHGVEKIDGFRAMISVKLNYKFN